METKKCFKCGVEKELSEFYKHSRMADGHVNKCKECNKKDVQNNYRLNIDHYKEYDKQRAKLPHRKKASKEYQKNNPEKIKSYGKKYYNNNKRKVSESKLNWIKNNPEKRKAHLLVQYEVRKGNIIKPEYCQICGYKTNKLDAHHHDYEKPLDVIFVCKKCHANIHAGNITSEQKKAV